MKHIFYKCGNTKYATGGGIANAEKQNEEMVESFSKSIKHHSAELDALVKKNPKVASWVVSKLERASTDMSDVTHYLDGRKAGKFAKGGGVGNDGWVKEAGISIGDILKYKKADSYVCVNSIGDSGVKANGFGAFFCDKDGIATAESGSSWTMWFREYEYENWEKTGHRTLEHVSKEKDGKYYSFYKSGNEKVDTYCSLLDDRYKFFKDYAPKNLQNKFDRLEDDNYHFTCGQLVDDFFNNPTWKHIKNHRLVLEDGGYLAKPQEMAAEKMAKGGAIGLNAKENWVSNAKEFKEKDLVEAGYSVSDAKKLSSKSWDDLEKSVQNAYKDFQMRDNIKRMKGMMESIYAYGGLSEDNNFLLPYKEELGSQSFDKVFKEYKKELEKYEVESGVYTDSEGCTYNSLKLKK